MKTSFATIILTLLLFSFSANAQDKLDVGAACETSEDCVSGNCSDGVCAAAEDNPNPAQTQITPKAETTVPQDPSKKKVGEVCSTDNQCASNQCKKGRDTSTKVIMINGVFCDVHANLTAALESGQCLGAIKPEPCIQKTYTNKTPEGNYVPVQYIQCNKDIPYRACICEITVDALKPHGCRQVSATIKTPDGAEAQKQFLLCEKDFPAKSCIKGTCSDDEPWNITTVGTTGDCIDITG